MSGYRWRGKRSEVPLCLCGCGEPAPVARKTDRRYGAVKGQPRRYIVGHNSPLVSGVTRGGAA